MKLSEFKNVKYGMSLRSDGKMNMSGATLKDSILLNRKIFFDKLDIDLKNIVYSSLAHDKNIHVAKEIDREAIITETDGLITNEKEIFLTVTISDCLPIYFYDNKKEAVGIAHAGWKGVVSNIVKEIINKMTENFDIDRKDLIVFIGPHIRKCHFEIKDDIIEKFEEYKEFIIEDNNKKFVDLSGILKKQLLDLGVIDENIEISEECTYCDDEKYTSFRRDKPEKPDSMIAYIGIK